MVSKKFGLGKGLGALIPEEETNEVNSPLTIPINLIKSNEKQPRKHFDEEKIMHLAESIKQHGIVQPIVLKKVNDTYVIIAGERRWRAAKTIGLKEVPAVVLEVTDKELLEISLIENIQREDLNPIEEAQAYTRLIEEFGLTQEELGVRVGKSRTAITNTLRLTNLDERVQQYLIEGIITEGHGRAILGVHNKDQQYKLAQTVIDENLSVRETEKLVNSMLKDNSEKEKTEIKSNPYIIDIKNRLEQHFGTKVNVNNKKNKGKIEIEYYSEEDLQRILDILNL